MNHRVIILGAELGTGELPSQGLGLLAGAQLLTGGAALVGRWAAECPNARQVVLGGGVSMQRVADAVSEAWRAGERVVVLADGDPLYFGLGASLIRMTGLKADAVRIIPAASSLQQACARLGLRVDKARSVSLHGREDWSELARAVQGAATDESICVLGDASHGPREVANWLLDRGADWLRLHLLTDMNSPHERHVVCSLDEAAAWTESPLAPTMILTTADRGRQRGPMLRLDAALPEVERHLQTKGPVRAVALAGLELRPGDTVWDIGAGSGSVAFGAAALAWRGQVWALEREPARVSMLHTNRRHLAALNVEIVHAQAPFGLDKLPDPDAVFVGGGLGSDEQTAHELLHSLYTRLRLGGRLVVATVLAASLERLRAFAAVRGTLDVSLIQSSHSAPLGQDSYFQAHNPVFVACLRKD